MKYLIIIIGVVEMSWKLKCVQKSLKRMTCQSTNVSRSAPSISCIFTNNYHISSNSTLYSLSGLNGVINKLITSHPAFIRFLHDITLTVMKKPAASISIRLKTMRRIKKREELCLVLEMSSLNPVYGELNA